MQEALGSSQLQRTMGMNGQLPETAMQQQQQRQQQRTQLLPSYSGIPTVDELATLSPHDFDHVSRLAEEMMKKLSPEDTEKINFNLSDMTPEKRLYLAQKNLEPMTYFFRSQALNQIRRFRLARLQTSNSSDDKIGYASDLP
ncbi:hypothetical protein PEX2_074730 [Penicillium expansum]|uniref:Uncharacterized protein n=1 Tax=Penicillium expansum TaxID=27334 RepID=A0A0A2I861_PENEN|nr:hypothetical protein PEX2_074730 [Penicillium expansum]KGO38603.1 hypothetical protein PEXP_082960 [Penicillium expansum]KGO59493.1 hypothetical protein PEX2_074730 [Penicillium expansum]